MPSTRSLCLPWEPLLGCLANRFSVSTTPHFRMFEGRQLQERAGICRLPRLVRRWAQDREWSDAILVVVVVVVVAVAVVVAIMEVWCPALAIRGWGGTSCPLLVCYGRQASGCSRQQVFGHSEAKALRTRTTMLIRFHGYG